MSQEACVHYKPLDSGFIELCAVCVIKSNSPSYLEEYENKVLIAMGAYFN